MPLVAANVELELTANSDPINVPNRGTLINCMYFLFVDFVDLLSADPLFLAKPIVQSFRALNESCWFITRRFSS